MIIAIVIAIVIFVFVAAYSLCWTAGQADRLLEKLMNKEE